MPAPLIRIYLATGNAHKVTEINTLLRNFGAPVEVCSAQTIGGMPQVEENADSFEGNARLKAQALLKCLQAAQSAGWQADNCATAASAAPLPPADNEAPLPPADSAASPPQPATAYVLADDSGLCVAALDNTPGIHSARYAGAHATDADNNALLLKNLAHLPPQQRGAAFVCCFVLIGTDGSEAVFHGRCKGQIAPQATGDAGFGYDPLFIPEGYERSFGELGAAIKNTISHRTHCCQQLAEFLMRVSLQTAQPE